MEQFKLEYNYLLSRYYNGCKYIAEHPETQEKYLPEILKIINDLNSIIIINNINDSNNILNGFKEE